MNLLDKKKRYLVLLIWCVVVKRRVNHALFYNQGGEFDEKLRSNRIGFANVIMGQSAMAVDFSYGLGFGIPYGGVGVNVDCEILPDVLALSLGVGFGSGYNDTKLYTVVGGKYFFTATQSRFRPRLSCYFGDTLDWSYSSDEGTVYYKGLIAGFGFSVDFGRKRQSGLEFDFPMVVLSDDSPYTVGSSISFGIGYRQKF